MNNRAARRAGTRPSAHHHRCARDIRFRMLVEAGQPEPPPPVLHEIAGAIRQHCGHRALKAHRLAWGYTIREAVDAAAVLSHGSCVPTERRWKAWEAGAHVNGDNQNLLCQLFHTTAAHLGLATDYGDEQPDPASTVATVEGSDPCQHATGSALSRGIPDGRVHPAHPAHPESVTARARHTGDHAGRLSIEGYILMTARESSEYADHPTDVGEATLELLRGELGRVARSFTNAPRLEVYTAAHRLRDWAFTLLDGRHRASESRDLYFTAAAACGILAESAALDFGMHAAGMAHARTAWLCAEQAGHDDLRAWVRVRQALIAYNDGRPAQAADYARQGQQYAQAGTISVWLPAIEARAAGALRDTETTHAALARVADAREYLTPNDLDELGGIMTFSVPKQHWYGSETYLGIGDSAAVAVDAEACIAGYRAGPEDERAYDNEASAQVNLATARVISGDLDAARDAAEPAMQIAPELRVATLDARLRRLNRALTAPGVRDSQVAVQLSDQVESFLATPSPTLPGV